jgi:hypothetical protein
MAGTLLSARGSGPTGPLFVVGTQYVHRMNLLPEHISGLVVGEGCFYAESCDPKYRSGWRIRPAFCIEMRHESVKFSKRLLTSWVADEFMTWTSAAIEARKPRDGSVTSSYV